MAEHGPLVAFGDIEDHVVSVAGVWQNDRTALFDLTCTCGWSWEPPEVDETEFGDMPAPTPMPKLLAAWLRHLNRETGIDYFAACVAALEAQVAASTPAPDDP